MLHAPHHVGPRREIRLRRLAPETLQDHGVEALFAWQPVPTCRYDIEHHLFRAESAAVFARHGPLQQGYALLDSLRGTRPELAPAAGFLWLADLQLGRREPLYVDAAHYTAAFSRDIAEAIARALAPRLGCGHGGDDRTGAAAQAE